MVARPILGDFLRRVYDDGGLGVTGGDRVVRPTLMPQYDCEDEAEPADQRASETGIDKDDAFFD